MNFMALRKTLPKNFDEIARSGDIEALQQVFQRSALNATGNSMSRMPAISYFGVPDEFVTWMVAQGADINQPDKYGETPLHHHAGSWRGNPALILQLGGELQARDNDEQTALFRAIIHPEHVRTLLAAGIEIDARDNDDETAMGAALARVGTGSITEVTTSLKLLIAAGAEITDEMRADVSRLSEEFEHIRDDLQPRIGRSNGRSSARSLSDVRGGGST